MISRRFLIAGFVSVALVSAGLSCASAAEKTARPWEYSKVVSADASALPDNYEFKVAKLGTSGQLLEEYRLSKYDVINIMIVGFSNSNIGTNDIMIGPDGYVQLPYAGMVKLAGYTVDEATKIITERLSEYIKIPKMSVMIKSYGPRKVYVMGEVKAPGIKELPIDSMNVYAALSSSGGYLTHARPRHVQVIRVIGDTMYYKEVDMEDYVKKHDMMQNLELRDGDIIYVPTSNKIDIKEDIMPYISIYGIYKNLTD